MKQLWLLLALTLVIQSCNKHFVREAELGHSYVEINGNQNDAPEIASLITPYRTELEDKMKLQIGEAVRELNNNPGQGESLLGNFAADLILDQSRKRFNGRVDMSLINAHGGLRVPIPKGPIRVENIYEVMPFENTIYLFELDGDLTKKLFDHCAKTLRSVVGGATFTSNGEEASDILIGGKAFDQTRAYTMAVSDYLSGGGGGFGFIAEGKFIRDLQYLQRDMILDFIKEQTEQGLKIDSRMDGRIKILSP